MAERYGRCEVCGAPSIPPRPPGKRGAPQRYCEPESTGRECRRFARTMTQLHSIMRRIEDSAHPRVGKHNTRLRLGGKTARAGHEWKHGD